MIPTKVDLSYLAPPIAEASELGDSTAVAIMTAVEIMNKLPKREIIYYYTREINNGT